MLVNTEVLKNKKNLLAFSGGTDSSALMFLLKEKNIPFDIIHVNYNTRKNSVKEERYARTLAEIFEKKIYVERVSEKITNNFEAKAREIRHSFFEKTIKENNYDNLITGHNLNDKVEWFLMQFTKGAGTRELFGMEPVTKKASFNIVRPLIETEKDEIMNYLNINNIKFFYDESNSDQKYKRNFFRHNYATELTKRFSKGIRNSFNILEKEVKKTTINVIEQNKEYILSKAGTDIVSGADQTLKLFGYLMSKEQREDFEENEFLTFKKDKNLYVISLYKDKLILTPYESTKVEKEDKEFFRKNGIPVKNRPYLSKNKKLTKRILND